MTPDAVPRDSTGTRFAAAPISTEKLPAPDPAAASSPSVSNQAKAARHQRRQRRADRQDDDAHGEHPARAVAIGKCSGDRLHRAPDELADCPARS